MVSNPKLQEYSHYVTLGIRQWFHGHRSNG